MPVVNKIYILGVIQIWETTAILILRWFILRWNIEVTFEEARAHLGIETQRQWSDLAIARTTPALFAMFSIIVLMAIEMLKNTTIDFQIINFTRIEGGRHIS